jgi:hypothetical protein
LKINRFSRLVSSPEKAGVGGSIPSLATTFSTAYKPSLRHFIPFHSKTMARDDSPRLECWSVAEWLTSRRADEIGNLSAAEKFDLLDAVWEGLEANELALTDGQRDELKLPPGPG